MFRAFEHLNFGFVSDFVLRISNFKITGEQIRVKLCNPLGSGLPKLGMT